MQTVTRVADLRRAVAAARAGGRAPVALVATMGNLHAGHLALVAAARVEGRFVVASIFVNPMQFPPGEDFACYPRSLKGDAELLAAAGVDLLFAPDESEILAGEGGAVRVQVEGLTDALCGPHRPGHFDGVTTIVAKLFNQVTPDLAFFGEKDYQQLVVIRRMVAALHFPVTVRGVPTVRAADGLALSSRNQYMQADERAAAPALYATLCAVAQQLAAGDKDYEMLLASGRQRLLDAGFRVEYLELRGPDLVPVPAAADLRGARVLAAVWLGSARLIDNVAVV